MFLITCGSRRGGPMSLDQCDQSIDTKTLFNLYQYYRHRAIGRGQSIFFIVCDVVLSYYLVHIERFNALRTIIAKTLREARRREGNELCRLIEQQQYYYGQLQLLGAIEQLSN